MSSWIWQTLEVVEGKMFRDFQYSGMDVAHSVLRKVVKASMLFEAMH